MFELKGCIVGIADWHTATASKVQPTLEDDRNDKSSADERASPVSKIGRLAQFFFHEHSILSPDDGKTKFAASDVQLPIYLIV